MIACPECGRPLEPFEITAQGYSWVHHPRCWHPETEETEGVEMTRESAIDLAENNLAAREEEVAEAAEILARLQTL